MARRPNKNAPQLKFVSWAIIPEYKDVQGEYTLTSPADRIAAAQRLQTLKPGVKEAEDAEFKKVMDTNRFLGDRPVGKVSPDPMVNLENLSKSLLNLPRVQRSFNRMSRLLRTEAIPVTQAGFVFEQKWQVKPTPEGTPPGKVWQFWIRVSSSPDNPAPQKFAWMLVEEQREDSKGGV